MSETVKAWRLTGEGEANLIIVRAELEGIAIIAEQMDVGDKYTIECISMDKEEFASLHVMEFEGLGSG